MSSLLDGNGNYRFLPKVIRDFHTQKKLIQAIYNDTNYYNSQVDSFYKIGWTQFHVNVMDFFLYNMAQRGYCLKKDHRFKTIELFEYRQSIQKNKIKPEIKDKNDDIKYVIEARNLLYHIDTYTHAETEIKTECIKVLSRILKERDNK